jgi:uncharacterized protein
MTTISDELIRSIRNQRQLPWDGIHGVSHWARVWETGLRLAARNRASPGVVELFAVFHDACRRNDERDPEHGRRGAELAAALRGSLIHLTDKEFSLLQTACTDHTKGLTAADITIQTCWDADRLDLGRVGIVPDPARLCTAAARDPDLMRWAIERSRDDRVPSIIRQAWDPPGKGGAADLG